MKSLNLIRTVFIAAILWAPISQASIVGYNVIFSDETGDPFFDLTPEIGMIWVDDTVIAGPNVLLWMFDFSYTGIFIGNGDANFAGPGLGPLPLTYDSSEMSLSGIITNPANQTLEFDFEPISSTARFELTVPDTFGGTISKIGSVDFAAKPPTQAPEPTTLFLIGVCLMLLSARKFFQVAPTKR